VTVSPPLRTAGGALCVPPAGSAETIATACSIALSRAMGCTENGLFEPTSSTPGKPAAAAVNGRAAAGSSCQATQSGRSAFCEAVLGKRLVQRGSSRTVPEVLAVADRGTATSKTRPRWRSSAGCSFRLEMILWKSTEPSSAARSAAA
jgi:hypothetical protein